MTSAQLVVVLGRPATGKTTLAQALTQHLHATYLSVDTIASAAAAQDCDSRPVEPFAHAVAAGIARDALRLHVHTVVDALSATHQERAAWVQLAQDSGAGLRIFETFVPNVVEWQRRVEGRAPAPQGERRLTWPEVRTTPYAAWDDSLDGARVPVDMTEAGAGIWSALQRLG